MDLSNFLHNLPNKPGVYMMQNASNQIIYVGKAKNLKNRVSSYFQNKSSKYTDIKTSALVKEIKNIEITVTNNETEALLLENKLINQIKPKYNVIFKDDKSYPYIVISNEKYPRVFYCRNKNIKNNKNKLGELYGPYPDKKSVKISLDLLCRIFKVRSCSAAFFSNRTRPCMEYQINRCSAPCVGLIDHKSYAADIQNIKLFLQTKSKALINNLTADMQQAAENLDYELAAKLRDQITALADLQKKQKIISKKTFNLDVLGVASSPKLVCIHLLRVRQGDVLYTRQFFSKNNMLNIDNQDEEFLENFIVQNYFSKSKQSKSNNKNNNFDYFEPANIEILTSINLTNRLLLSKVIGSKISCAKAGDKLAWQKIAQNSAVEALATRVVEYRRQKNNFQQLTNLLGRSKPIERIACFDISHTTGKETIGACVVFNLFGKEKANFRLFNLNLEQKADDYQALQQTITRYLSNIIEKPHLAPELIMVDGGKGQLSIAEQVIASLQQELTKKKIFISLLAIAKGKDRKPGLEKIYLTASGDQLSLQSSSPVFKLLQTIRDAAHKFAISSHRRKRDRLAK